MYAIRSYYEQKGDFEKAMQFYNQSLEIDKKTDNKNGVASSLNNIGNILQKQGNYKSAIDYYIKVLNIRELTRITSYNVCYTKLLRSTLNVLAIAERDALLSELEEMHWNISRVAKKLALSRNTLYRRMTRYGITPPR